MVAYPSCLLGETQQEVLRANGCEVVAGVLEMLDGVSE